MCGRSQWGVDEDVLSKDVGGGVEKCVDDYSGESMKTFSART